MQEPRHCQSFAVVGDCVASDCTALDLDKLHRVQAHQQVNNHNLLWLLANHFHRTLSCNFFYPSRRIRKKQRTNKKYVGFFYISDMENSKTIYIRDMVFSNLLCLNFCHQSRAFLNCAGSVKQVCRCESVYPHLSAARLEKKGTTHFATCSVSMHCTLLVLKLSSSLY